jgi:hypothetical protein
VNLSIVVLISSWKTLVPQRDSIHEIIKQALIRDGWEITDDPYVIDYGERFLFVDLGATELSPWRQTKGQIIGAQFQGKRIAVEIKEFRGKSVIADLEQAVGQYVLYDLLLKRIDPEREIYMAVTDDIYLGIFSEPVGEVVISGLPLRLLIVHSEEAEVIQWIPGKPTATL